MTIIPALNCLDSESVIQRLTQTSTFLQPGSWIHLDISDGKFTYTKTWNDPLAWGELAGQYNFTLEVHLMVESPEEILELWIKAGAKRAIVHVETITLDSLQAMFAIAAQYKVDIMLSLNAGTPIEELRPYIKTVYFFQVLAVNPGLSGQKFQPLILEKVAFLRALRPNAKIEVDGGINPETAKLCKDAGVDFVVASSFLFWREDSAIAYQELKEAIGN